MLDRFGLHWHLSRLSVVKTDDGIFIGSNTMIGVNYVVRFTVLLLSA
jgi:hypothetical protein